MRKTGDAAFASFGSFGRVKVKRGTVIKVTPKGQVVVDFKEVWPGNGAQRTRRFNPDGGEIGGEVYGSGRLIDEASFDRLAKKQEGQEATEAMVAHLRSWSFKNKAELNELVAKLIELADRVPDDESTASAIEARRAETLGSVEDESAGPKDDAQGGQHDHT
jgi:hypothetical protein